MKPTAPDRMNAGKAYWDVSGGQETVNLSEYTPRSAFTDEVYYSIDNEN
jgi:hypothetical protein